MPTKDERIASLEKEVENYREQLKMCKLALGKPEAEAKAETSPVEEAGKAVDMIKSVVQPKPAPQQEPEQPAT